MLQLKEFKMNGAFSYGECHVNFKPGLVLIDGQNLDEGEGVSNMAGKSSLFNGVTTVLFEENAKGQTKDDIINTVTGGQADIQIKLKKGIQDIEIGYSRGKKNDWWINVDGEMQTKSMKDMKRFIPELIGMSYNMFTVASYMEQGRMSKILEMDAKERMDLIASYFGLDKADVFRRYVKEAKAKINEEYIQVKARIGQLNTLIVEEGLSEKIRALETKLQGMDAIPVSLAEYEQAAAAFNTLKELYVAYPNVVSDVTNIKALVQDCSGKIGVCEEIIAKVTGNKCYVCGGKINSKKLVKDTNKDLESLTVEYERQSTQLAKYEDVKWKLRGFDPEAQQEKLERMRQKVGDPVQYRSEVERLGQLKQQRKLQDQKDRDLATLTEQLNEAQQTIDVLDFWFDGFSPRGIPAMVMEKLLSGWNNALRYYGEKFNWHIDAKIENDRLVIKAEDRYKHLKVEHYSGSENMIINMILSFGSWSWLNKRGGGTNVLFLDEVLAPFDAVMRTRMAEYLKEISKNRFVGLVTHNDDVKSMLDFDAIWMVEKKNGISNLRVY